MQSKPSNKTKAGNHLYEFAQELGATGSIADRKRFAEESTDATAAKNAVNQWRGSTWRSK
jgi:hypothetical protein